MTTSAANWSTKRFIKNLISIPSTPELAERHREQAICAWVGAGRYLMVLPTSQIATDDLPLPPTHEGDPGTRAVERTTAGHLLRVLIVSDVRFLRESLSDILSRHSELAIVGMADDGSQALELALAARPSAVLLDTSLPGGLETVASIVAVAPDIPIIALAIVEAEHEILAWAEAGIAGYVPRCASISDIIGTVSRAVHGEQVCSAKVAGAMIRRLRQLAEVAREQRHGRVGASLTAREREIAGLIAEGLSNKLIARRLHIEVATAKCHVHNILDKLKLPRRGDVALWIQYEGCRPEDRRPGQQDRA